VEKIGDRPNGRQEDQTRVLRNASLYIAVAFELPGTILGGMLVGYFLDNYLHTSPWFLIALTALAFVTAIARLIRWANVFARRRNANGTQKDHTAH
jgi:F0F1-type ATP synthase assembly protein I